MAETTEPKVSIANVEDLFHATRALLIAMKEEDNPEDLARYIEGVEDALAKVEEETGWEAAVEAEIERQIAEAGSDEPKGLWHVDERQDEWRGPPRDGD